MPVETIAHALPYVNWILLVALAGGCFAFAVLAGERTDATRGYLRFTAFAASGLALLVLLSDLSLPAPVPGMVIVAAPPPFDTVRRLALAAFAASAVVHVLVVGRGGRRAPWAVAGLAALGVALAAAAFGWSADQADGVPLLVQLVCLSAAAGGALAALVLGHWYLVTPRISITPLVLLTRVLAGVVLLQLALFTIWALFGGGPGQGPFDSLTGSSALYGWLRLVVSLIFPLVLAIMAWRTSLTRSMESATGLLYIAIAAIAAGTIGAAALYVTQGVLV